MTSRRRKAGNHGKASRLKRRAAPGSTRPCMLHAHLIDDLGGGGLAPRRGGALVGHRRPADALAIGVHTTRRGKAGGAADSQDACTAMLLIGLDNAVSWLHATTLHAAAHARRYRHATAAVQGTPNVPLSSARCATDSPTHGDRLLSKDTNASRRRGRGMEGTAPKTHCRPHSPTLHRACLKITRCSLLLYRKALSTMSAPQRSQPGELPW